jgi:hypothetical protein
VIGSLKKNVDNLNYPDDIARWSITTNISEEMIEYYLINKPCNVGNIENLKVSYTERGRIYYRMFQFLLY